MKDNRQSGFTLLEIIIATGLLAMMSISMMGMTDNIITRRERASTRNNVRHGVAIAMTKMTDDLRTAFQSDSKYFGQDKYYQTGFVGDANTLNFSTMSNVHFIKNKADTDQVQVGYSTNKNDQGNLDLIRRQTNTLTDDLEKGGQSFVLMKNIKEIEFAYYDSNKKDWKEKWNTASASSQGRLPQIVKIKMTVFGEPELSDEDTLKEYSYEIHVPIEMYKAKLSF